MEATSAKAAATGKRARATVHVYDRYCKGCRICVEICPQDVLAIGNRVGPTGQFIAEVVAPDACTACMMCEIACPDLAITVVRGDR